MAEERTQAAVLAQAGQGAYRSQFVLLIRRGNVEGGKGVCGYQGDGHFGEIK